jgi:hypothetical protein
MPQEHCSACHALLKSAPNPIIKEWSMAKRRKVWMYCPPKPNKQKVPDGLKVEVSAKSQKLIDEHLNPTHIKPPPKNPEFNYLTELFTRWYHSYFYSARFMPVLIPMLSPPHSRVVSPAWATRETVNSTWRTCATTVNGM